MPLNRSAKLRRFKLAAGNVRENDAVAPRKEQFPPKATVRMDQRLIALQEICDLLAILARLLQRIQFPDQTFVGYELDLRRSDRSERVELPILNFESEKTSTRMQDHEVRMEPTPSKWNVVPDDIVGFELRLKPLGETTLTACHPTLAATEGRDDRRPRWRKLLEAHCGATNRVRSQRQSR